MLSLNDWGMHNLEKCFKSSGDALLSHCLPRSSQGPGAHPIVQENRALGSAVN